MRIIRDQTRADSCTDTIIRADRRGPLTPGVARGARLLRRQAGASARAPLSTSQRIQRVRPRRARSGLNYRVARYQRRQWALASDRGRGARRGLAERLRRLRRRRWRRRARLGGVRARANASGAARRQRRRDAPAAPGAAAAAGGSGAAVVSVARRRRSGARRSGARRSGARRNGARRSRARRCRASKWRCGVPSHRGSWPRAGGRVWLVA